MQRIFNKIQEIIKMVTVGHHLNCKEMNHKMKFKTSDIQIGQEIGFALLRLLLPDENIQAWGSWLRFATPTSIHRQKRSWLSLRYAYFCLMKIFRLGEVGLDKLGLLPFISRKEVGFRYATPTSA